MIKTIEQRVINFIDENNLIEKGDRVLVALSGGPDSVFLTGFLHKYRKRFGIDIAAFHLNHKLRGKESYEDELFCKKYAARLGIRFFSKSKNVKLSAARKRISLEEAGRNIRYDELKKIAKKYGYNKIATAHNKGDNAETILLNLFKGTGIKGIAGIPVQRENIIRPILVLSKEEITEYLGKKKTNFRIDSSNLESDFQRNFLRNEIIPLIRGKINPELESALFRTSVLVKKVVDYIDELIDDHIDKSVSFKNGKLLLDTGKLIELDNRLQGYLIKRMVKKYYDIDLESLTLTSIERLIKKQVGKEIKLTGELIVKKERKQLVLYKKGLVQKKISVKIKPGTSKKINGKIISVKEIDKKSFKKSVDGNKEYIDAGKIRGGFVLSNWKEGDSFHPLGMKGTKKISDFLTDMKIDSHKRKEQLVLTNNGKIVWVVGLRIDDRFKVTNKTGKVYELWIR